MGKRGGLHSHKEDDKVLETLMKNMQNIDENGENEYVFLATNFVDSLDPASIRSGRINSRVKFELPNYNCRKALFSGYINNKNKIAGYKVIRNFNMDALVESTNGFNCADIESAIDKAIHMKIKKEIRKKPKGCIPAYWIGEQYLLNAIHEIKASKTLESKIGFYNK